MLQVTLAMTGYHRARSITGMMRLAAIVFTAIATSCLSTTAAAEVNPPARVQAFAKLPDWSGIWISSGSAKTFDPAGKPPPYNDEWLDKYTPIAKTHKKPQDSLQQFCIAGVPRLSASAYPFMIMVTPEETLIHYAHRELRHIWTDGREHPSVDELWPTAWGDSVGHWEAQTLVIDTVSTKPDLWIDTTGATLSAQTQITERISAVDNWHLKNEITIDDPTSLTKPWKVTRYYRHTLATELVDEYCDYQGIKAGK